VVRVLTVDDQAVFRGIAREVIDATSGFESAGEVASGEEALQAVEQLQPNLVLVDVPGFRRCEAHGQRANGVVEPCAVVLGVRGRVSTGFGPGCGASRSARRPA